MRAALLALLLVFGGPLQAAEPEPLLVMTDLWPPFRMLDDNGELQGLDIDLLEQLSQRTGLRFEVLRAPWARGLAALEQGKADLMTGLAKTAEREAYVRYLPRPYYACAPRFYTAPEQAPALLRYDQLAQLNVGQVLGSAYFEPFDSDQNLRKTAVNNEAQLLGMLARGRLGAVIGTDCQVDYELRDPRWAARIAKAAYRPAARTELYIGFSRRRPLQAEYRRVSEALEQLRAEGWIAEAARRYRVQVP
ncbi:substrate-binding periplasmic protein [Pseudomonas benzenivorans]|uniref:Amino acid ABC transporter substrate-binding protein n=1 Tax=Pseudomonas benzenivorans TaxID=556533 RepID=A0ABY5H5L6_9PSED|nr:transporter substrate-binding domain-containing protein [Pseudomonas benzenivorans]UTW06605.1 amino acid ABC transporter substrate-binding protein [Pseudomonas benzenivorans]